VMADGDLGDVWGAHGHATHGNEHSTYLSYSFQTFTQTLTPLSAGCLKSLSMRASSLSPSSAHGRFLSTRVLYYESFRVTALEQQLEIMWVHSPQKHAPERLRNAKAPFEVLLRGMFLDVSRPRNLLWNACCEPAYTTPHHTSPTPPDIPPTSHPPPRWTLILCR
jgi:hypothetical protein